LVLNVTSPANPGEIFSIEPNKFLGNFFLNFSLQNLHLCGVKINQVSYLNIHFNGFEHFYAKIICCYHVSNASFCLRHLRGEQIEFAGQSLILTARSCLIHRIKQNLICARTFFSQINAEKPRDEFRMPAETKMISIAVSKSFLQ